MIERLNETYDWIRKSNCCGEVCTDGICMAPACSFGEALNSIGLAMKHIAELQLRNDNQAVTIGDMQIEVASLKTEKATLREALADMLVLAADLGHANNSEPARNAKRILGWNDY